MGMGRQKTLAIVRVNTPGLNPPKRQDVAVLYNKYLENLAKHILPEIPNEEGLRKFWEKSGNYHALKTWLDRRIKQIAIERVRTKTTNPPTIEVVADLYD